VTAVARPEDAMEIERRSGVALWRQIEQYFERSIREGTLHPGQKLPTEHQLSAEFRVNRHTVRRAMGCLEERGIVRVEQGRGMFVAEDVIDYVVGRRTRFTENLSRQSRIPGGRTILTRPADAEAAVAGALRIRKGAPVALIRRQGEADGRPLSISDHYFPLARLPTIIEVFAEEGSVTRSLARLGIADYVRKTTRVTARLPTRMESDLLRQHRNRPLLVTEGINVDRDGTPVEYGVTRFAADRVQLVFEP
jgi:GntR family transcriptional regulator, phosphonate transport system regulatory protein